MEDKYNFETEKPAQESQGQQPEAGFGAGQTGQEEYARQAGFDPVTGQLRQENGGWKNAPSMGPYGGLPQEPKPKKKLVPLIIGISIFLVVAVAVLGVVVVSRFFSNDKNKVIVAIANTFEAPEIWKAFNSNDIVTSDAYTIELGANIEGVILDLDYLQTRELQALNGSIGAAGVEGKTDFYSVLDEEKLAAKLPFLDDKKLFVYYYRQENQGYLMDFLEESGIPSWTLNNYFIYLHEGAKAPSAQVDYKELAESILETYNELKFEKIDKRSFDIDGKQVSCSGYQLRLTRQRIEEMLDQIKQAQGAMAASIQSLQDAVSYMEGEEVELRFYIHQKKLAAIQVTADGITEEIRFEGGARRTQNMSFYVDGLKLLSVVGTTEGKKETTTLKIMGMELAHYSYDAGSGVIEAALSLEELYGIENIYFNGTVSSDKERPGITNISLKEGEEVILLDGSILFSKGAEIEALQGEEFDLGNASVYDTMEYFGTLYEDIYD